MPTSYTAKLNEGEQDFEEFALTCARALGALIDMRDDRMDAKIPEQFEPSDYYKESLEKSRGELFRLESMTTEQIKIECDAEYARRLEDDARYKRKQAGIKARYEAMLKQVRAWTPPTAGHAGLRDFMIQQLEESIEHDCNYTAPAPVRQTPEKWHRNRIESAEKSLEYAAGAWEKERNRAKSKTEWVQILRQSLKGGAR